MQKMLMRPKQEKIEKAELIKKRKAEGKPVHIPLEEQPEFPKIIE
jgi:hypothetical protein